MENPVPIPELQVENLNPPAPTLPSHRRRRSHLDSASYRTLVRILSHCLDHSLIPTPRPPSADPNPTAAPENGLTMAPTAAAGGPEILVDPECPNPRGDVVDELPAGPESGKQQSCEATVEVSPSTGEAVARGDGSEVHAEGVDSRTLGDLVPKIDAQDDLFRTVEELLNDDNPVGETPLNPEDWCSGLLDGDKNQARADGCASAEDGVRGSSMGSGSEDAREMPSDKTSELEVEIMEGEQQEMRACSDSAADCSGFRNLDSVVVSRLLGLESDKDFEEGEIPDEVQALEDQKFKGQELVQGGDSKEDNRDHMLATFSGIDNDGCVKSRENSSNGDRLNSPIRDKGNETRQMCRDNRCLESRDILSYSSVYLGENKENLVTQNIEPSNAKSLEVQAKKTRGPLTEERKAKKKSAKKRKKAQKDREQGIKRLKLQPIVKPKVVKQCNFYMIGRCIKDDCRFSHDAVPLTKSKPCTYFAKDSCLKGDDCPFDHQLSKYPCHNYMSKGMCIRGDKCKFSHKISSTEDSSISTVGKSHSPLSSEKQLNANSTSQLANGLPKSTSSVTPSSLSKHLETNLVKSLKEPLRVPSGVRFLSFGKGSSDSAKKQEKLLMEKQGGDKMCNQQNQEKFGDRCKNTLPSVQKAPRVAQSESNMVSVGAVHYPARSTLSNMKFKNNSLSSGPVIAPFSQSLKNEVSDATKILDEFLFGSGSLNP